MNPLYTEVRQRLRPTQARVNQATPAPPAPPKELLSQAVQHSVDLDVDSRLGLQRLLTHSKLNYCDFDYLHMIEPLSTKDSQSNSVVTFAKLKSGDEVALCFVDLTKPLVENKSVPKQVIRFARFLCPHMKINQHFVD